MVENVIRFISKIKIMNIPLIATAPSCKINEKLRALFTTYELVPFSDEAILKIILEKLKEKNLSISAQQISLIIREAKGIPRRAIEFLDIINLKNINTNEIYRTEIINYKGNQNNEFEKLENNYPKR